VTVDQYSVTGRVGHFAGGFYFSERKITSRVSARRLFGKNKQKIKIDYSPFGKT
jgi:hypothetical protein